MMQRSATRKRVSRGSSNAGNDGSMSRMRHTASTRDAALGQLVVRNRQRALSLEALVDKYRLFDDAPSSVQALRSFPARDISSNFNLPKVLMTQSIIDVLRDLGTEEVVLVREWAKPEEKDGPRGGHLLWSKSTFLESALKADRMDRPISEIAGSVDCCPLINEMDTLDHVLDTMVVTGFQQVGTVDDEGVITGVILFNDLYRFLLQQVEREEPVSSKKTKDRFSEKAEAEDLTSNPVIRGGSSMVSRLEAIKDRYRSKEIGNVQRMAQEWVEALTTELLIMVLVLLDISCTIFEQVNDDLNGQEEIEPLEQPLMSLTGTILLVYTFEASVRVFGYRWSILWRFLDLVDLLVVIASIIVYLIVITKTGNAYNIRAAVQAARVLRFLRIIKLMRRLRKILTASKTRYQQDGFNLDLSYVTPSCICMALPAVGAEANFLNPLEEVQRFFADKHPSHFLIFNLCAERYYDARLFGGRVERIVIENHNPPLLDQVVSFLEHAASFLEEDPSNVVAIHCKNGRGRSCVMVCAWLVYCGFVSKSSDAIEWFCQERYRGKPSDLETETTASQRRYIHYAEQVIGDGGFTLRRLRLMKIVLKTCPMVDLDKRCNPWFTIEENLTEAFESALDTELDKDTEEKAYADLGVELSGDIRITFYDRHEATGKDEIIFYLCFHTAYVPHDGVLQMKKPTIDIACNDTVHKIFKPDFAVILHFERAAEQDPWHKMQPASSSLREVSQRQRGLFNTSKSAAIGSIVFAKPEQELDDFSLDPVGDNLSIAPGPAVSHSQTKMYAYTGGSVHSHAQSKRLVWSYANKKDGGKGIGKALTKAAKHAVSGNKRRFQEDGFDLDLTYITPRLIAMGFPSQGVERHYRNNEEDVYKFFQQRHSGHYRIINLCSERNYSLNTFHGSVARYPFPDHNPPPMELILPCCSHMHTWMQGHQDNIVAVHCKAGKGRTGLMIVCYLMYGGLTTTASTARKYYDTARTFDGKGLTIVSQIRYVHYFEELLRRRKRGEPLRVTEKASPAMLIRRVRMVSIPHMDRDRGCDPYFSVAVVSEEDHELYEVYGSKEHHAVEHVKPAAGRWDAELMGGQGLRVAGDVHFEFRDQDLLSSERMFSFWLHTQFVTSPPSDMGGKARQLSAEEAQREGLPAGCWSLTLEKREIDQAARDKKDVLFDKHFAVQIFFQELPGQHGTGDRLAEGEKRNSKGQRPLYLEREMYQTEAEKASLTGQHILPMEEWILQNQSQVSAAGLSAAPVPEPDGASEASLSTGAGPAEAPAGRTVFRLQSPLDSEQGERRMEAPNGWDGGAERVAEATTSIPEESSEADERVQLALASDVDAIREPGVVQAELASNLCAALEVSAERVVCGAPVAKGCTVEVTLRASPHQEQEGLGAKLLRMVQEDAEPLQRGRFSKHIREVLILDSEPEPAAASPAAEAPAQPKHVDAAVQTEGEVRWAHSLSEVSSRESKRAEASNRASEVPTGQPAPPATPSATPVSGNGSGLSSIIHLSDARERRRSRSRGRSRGRSEEREERTMELNGVQLTEFSARLVS